MDDVCQYYDSEPEKEWQRTMNSSYSSIEYELVQRCVLRNLPPNSNILDLGCGTGRHAIGLARQNHRIGLVDISENSLKFATEKFRAEGLSDSILHIDCASAATFLPPLQVSYNAVLLFGPLYHLTNLEERQDCLRNAVVNLKPGGFVFAIFLTYFSVFKDFMKRGWFSEIRKLLETSYLENGIYEPPSQRAKEDYMPGLYATSGVEACGLLRNSGLEVSEIISCESFAAFMRPYVEKVVKKDDDFKEMIEILEAVSMHPALPDGGDHFMIAAQKKLPEDKQWWAVNYARVDDYLVSHPTRNAISAKQEIDFIFRQIPARPETCIVDIGCGTGDHLLELARQGCENLIGIDLSAEMLERAKKQAEAEKLEITWENTDMRNINGFAADVILTLYNSVGFFEFESDDILFFRAVHNVLKPRGYFVLDVFPKESCLRNLERSSWEETGEVILLKKQTPDSDTKRLFRKTTIIYKDGFKRFERTSSVRMFEAEVLLNILETSGFTIVGTWGDYEDKPFDSDKSERMVIIAQRL